MATKVGPGTIEETAKPDAAATAAMDGANSTAVARRSVTMDGMLQTAGGSLALRPTFMQITYGVGELATKGFSNGAFVLAKTDEIAKMGQKLTVIIGGAVEYWKQWMSKDDYASGARAKAYASEADAIKAGEITQWGPKGSGAPKPTVSLAYELLLLVQRPDAGCTSGEFVLKLGGKFYAPARFTADKDLYKDIARMVTNARLFEAGERGVPPQMGRLDGYFMTLNTHIVKDPSGNTKTHIALNFLRDANNAPIAVPEAVRADLLSLGQQMQAAASAPVASEDDVPPASAGEPPAAAFDM